VIPSLKNDQLCDLHRTRVSVFSNFTPGPMVRGEATGAKLILFPMKNQHHNGPIHPTTRALIHETIASRAYELWEKYGKREGQALDNWLQAEHELLSGKRVRRPASNPTQPGVEPESV
jgi:hypothetical protein